MSKILNTILVAFYNSFLGELYFNFILWAERRRDRQRLYLNPKEVAQIIREYSLLSEGVTTVKHKINELVLSKSAEEYHQVLSQIQDMVSLAEREYDSPKAKLADILYEIGVKKGNQDIVTVGDKVKMVDQRIQDMYELHNHINKRKLLREIRAANKSANKELAQKLEQEFKEKYGRSNTRS